MSSDELEILDVDMSGELQQDVMGIAYTALKEFPI